MKVLIVGATGNVGRRAVREALAAGHEVTAFARDPARVELKDERLRVATGDVRHRDSLVHAAAGQDAVVSCLGTAKLWETRLRREGTRNIVEAMQSQGVRRLVIMSALGAGDSKAEARRFAPFFMSVVLPVLLRAHVKDMDEMEEVVRASDLEWVIVRPAKLTDNDVVETPMAVLGGARSGKAVSKPTAAAFMVSQLTDDRYVRMAPSLYAQPRPRP